MENINQEKNYVYLNIFTGLYGRAWTNVASWIFSLIIIMIRTLMAVISTTGRLASEKNGMINISDNKDSVIIEKLNWPMIDCS